MQIARIAAFSLGFTPFQMPNLDISLPPSPEFPPPGGLPLGDAPVDAGGIPDAGMPTDYAPVYLYPVQEATAPASTQKELPVAPAEKSEGIGTGTVVAIGVGALLVGALLFGNK